MAAMAPEQVVPGVRRLPCRSGVTDARRCPMLLAHVRPQVAKRTMDFLFLRGDSIILISPPLRAA